MADDKLVTHLVLDGVGGYMRGLSRVEYGLGAGAKAAENFRKRTERISQAASAVGNVGMKMMMVGGAMVAAAGMAVKAAATEEAAQDKLRKIWSAGADEVIRYAAERQKLTRFGDDETVAAAAVGATYVNLRGTMKQAIAAAQDISEAYGIDLTQSMHMLGKASGGMVTNLRRVGIMVDANDFKARGMAAVYDEVKHEFSDVAVTSNSTEKALAQMRNAVGDAAEKIGNVLLPYVKSGALWIKQLAERFSDLPLPVQRAIAFLIGGGGLALALAGVALKLVATVVQIWFSITAGRIWIATLRAERDAALLAAQANKALGASRAGAAGGAGAAVGAGAVAGPATVVAVGVATVILSYREWYKILMGVTGAIQELNRAQSEDPYEAFEARKRLLEMIEKSGKVSAAQAQDLADQFNAEIEQHEERRKQLALTREAYVAFIREEKAAAAEAALSPEQRLGRAMIRAMKAGKPLPTAESMQAADEERARGTALAETVENAKELVQSLDLVNAMEKAGAATAAQSYAARAALLQNLVDQWGLMSEKERGTDDVRKLQMAAWAIYADQVNAKEKDRKDLLEGQKKAIEDQTRAIEDQLGLLDARVGYAQAYADYLKAVGRGGEAGMIERNVIPGLQREGMQRAFWAEQWYGARGMEMQAMQAGTQKWRYGAEAAQAGKGRGLGYQTRAQVNVESIRIPMERTFTEQRSNETMLSLSGVN